jgi:aryl-alcohol dehydrogenase-like predicted oxidoreductase
MEYRRLGDSGLRVSAVGLGGMTFGRETPAAEAHRMLDAFVGAGGTLIDTADAYGQGASESVIGDWLHQRDRDEVVLATKVRFGTGPGPNSDGLGRRHILDALEGSLRRLRTDHLDVYLTHLWDDGVRLEETLATLDGVVREGKVRYLGVSNVSGWQLQRALGLASANGWERFTVLQPLYNLIDREAEWELLAVARNERLGVVPWSPLRGGWLAGRLHRGMEGPPAGTRIAETGAHAGSETWSVYDQERTWRIIDALDGLAAETGRSPASLAIAWVASQPGITSPLLGARRLEQLEQTLADLEPLTPEQAERLTAASVQRLPYPYHLQAGSWSA